MALNISTVTASISRMDDDDDVGAPKLPAPTSGSASFAHPVVRKALALLLDLEGDWCRARNEEDDDIVPECIADIEALINLIGQDKTFVEEKKAGEIFHYLCGAVIYSGAILHSAIKQCEDESIESDGTTSAALIPVPKMKKSQLDICDEVVSRVNLKSLNHIARRIVQELQESMETRVPKVKVNSAGQIPYLLVSSKEYQVMIRNGFELAKSHRSFARKVESLDAEVDNFPNHIVRSSQSHMNSKIPEAIADLIPELERREKLLKGKYITWIHMYPSSFQSAKTQVEIDVIDELIYEDPKKAYLPQQRLRELAGRDRHLPNMRTTRMYTLEDLMITYCAKILFDFWRNSVESEELAEVEHKKKEGISQILQGWSNDCIRNYALNIYRNSPMYIGFSWGTIIDAGYADQSVVSGSTNTLLLALTRGLVKLAENSNKSNIFMGRNSIEHFPCYNHTIRHKMYGVLTNIGLFKPIVMTKSRTENRIRRKVEKKYGMVYKNKLRGYTHLATSEGITIKSKPTGFVIFVFLAGFLVFLAYCVLMGIRQRTADNYEEYIGGMISLPPLLVGICIFVIKLRFPKWELLDIINGRMYTETFSDLSSALRAGKIEATRVIASVENPKEVFACKGANPFVSSGAGDFKIDEKFNVRELQEAGFLFGVDYYAYPVVINCQGVVRKIKFPEIYSEDHVKQGKGGTTYYQGHEGIATEEDTSDDEESMEMSNARGYNSLQVGHEHSIQPSLVFKIPITNMIVR